MNTQAIANPLVYSKNVAVGTPEFVSQTAGGIRVRFRELITSSIPTLNVAEPEAFTVSRMYNVNPGLFTTFPWLSQIANRYDQYRLHSATFEYVPGVSATTNGFIYMVPDYQVTDNAPTDARQAMNQMGSVSTAAWAPISMSLRPQAAMSLGPRRFVRSQTTQSDQVTTDVAKVYILRSGVTSLDLQCQIWVHYDIELFAPQIEVAGGAFNRNGKKKESATKVKARTSGAVGAGAGVQAQLFNMDSIDEGYDYNGLQLNSGERLTAGLASNSSNPTSMLLKVGIDALSRYQASSFAADTDPAVADIFGKLSVYGPAGNLLETVDSINAISTAILGGKTGEDTPYNPVKGDLRFPYSEKAAYDKYGLWPLLYDVEVLGRNTTTTAAATEAWSLYSQDIAGSFGNNAQTHYKIEAV